MRRLTFLVLAQLSLGTSACDRPGLRVKMDDSPPQRTISELLVRYDTATFPSCEFPDATPQSMQAVVSRDSALRLALGGTWRLRDIDDRFMDSATSSWRRDGGGGIQISRELNGGRGPAWLETRTHRTIARPTCLTAQGDAGAIWRLYDPADPKGAGAGQPYDGLAEVITRDSLRYEIMIRGPSAALRDSLAAQVTRAILQPGTDS